MRTDCRPANLIKSHAWALSLAMGKRVQILISLPQLHEHLPIYKTVPEL